MYRRLAAFPLMLALGLTAVSGEACTLSMGWEPYGVYSYRDQQGVLRGFDIDLVRTLGAEVGCGVEFRHLPWARHLKELEAGRVDVASSVRKTPERAQYGRFSIPYRVNEMALYVRRGERQRYALQSLASIPEQQFRLGIVKGYFYGDEFTRLMESEAFAEFTEAVLDYRTNIQMLVHGRIDGFLADDVGVVLWEARRLDMLARIENYPLPIAGGEFHLLFSRASVPQDLFDRLEQSLTAMQADGRLQTLLDTYLKGL